MSDPVQDSVRGDYIVAELAGSWLTVWFNQPEKRNPLSDEMTAELLAVLENAALDEEIRGVTLRGRGGFFCAGGDLSGFHRMASASHDEIVAISENAARLFACIDTHPKATIAVVEGAAMAGGLGMVCCCDVALGMQDARFGFSEARIGITAAQIAPYVVAKVGPATARRLLVTAARFDGNQAGRFGLIDAVAEDVAALEQLEASIRNDVLGCAPGAIAATKQLLRELPLTHPDNIPRLAAKNFATAFLSPEGREGIASFVEKRMPEWYPES